MSNKYNMKDLMKERDIENKLDRVMNKLNKMVPEIEPSEYVFQLSFERNTKILSTRVAMPPALIAEGIASVLAGNNTTIEQLEDFLQIIFNKTIEIQNNNKDNNL